VARVVQGKRPISYHNGPVMRSGVKIYYILVRELGTGSDGETRFLTDLCGRMLARLSGPYFAIKTGLWRHGGEKTCRTLPRRSKLCK